MRANVLHLIIFKVLVLLTIEKCIVLDQVHQDIKLVIRPFVKRLLANLNLAIDHSSVFGVGFVVIDDALLYFTL